MDVSATQPQGGSGGILAFLRGSKNDEEKPPLRIGGSPFPDAQTVRGVLSGPPSDFRGLGVGQNLDVQA